jgi:PAS domain S-box-containing protein
MQFTNHTWLLLSIWTTLATSLVLLFIFTMAMRTYGSRFARYWIAGWFFYSVRFIFELLSVYFPGSVLYTYITLFLSSISAVFLFFAALSLLVHQSFRKYILLFSFLFSIWIVSIHLLDISFIIASLPIFILLGIVQIATGIFFLFNIKKSNAVIGSAIAGIALVLWGLHKLDYPFLRTLPFFAVIGFQIGSFLQILTGIGVITYLFQNSEKSSHENELRFRAIFDNAPIGILILNNKGEALLCNHSFELITGLHFSQFKKIPPLFLTHPDDADEENKRMNSLLTQKAESFSMRKRIIKPDKTVRWIFSESVRVVMPELGDNIILQMIQDITSLKEHEVKLQESLNEKNVMLREIHHRVKNNLQIISSLLSLQQIKKENPEESFNKARSRIKSIALIHEQLYRSDNFTNIDFKNHIMQISNEIIGSQQNGCRHKIICNGEDLTLHIDTAVPLGIIVHEIINNSIRHAFTDDQNGTITITIIRSSQSAEIIISDNGSGFCPDDSVVYSTLGLVLIKELSRQIRATTRFECDNGTKISIRIPLQQPD